MTDPQEQVVTEPQEQTVSPVVNGAGQDPYKVRLDAFNGPMDLLLYLVSKSEVDIHDIPIARIIDQYLEYLEVLQASDVEVTGDFIVMASTLMLIKSRLLLPTEEVDLEEEIDPQDDLIRQLLEYKKYKLLSRALDEKGREHAMREGRPKSVDKAAAGEIPLEEVDLYDLVKAFAKVLDDTGQGWGTSIIHSEKPVTAYIVDIVTVLQTRRECTFADLFVDVRSKDDALGLFIGILELTRLRAITLAQEQPRGTITISCIADAEQLEKLRALDLESVLIEEDDVEKTPLWREPAPPIEDESVSPEAAEMAVLNAEEAELTGPGAIVGVATVVENANSTDVAEPAEIAEPTGISESVVSAEPVETAEPAEIAEHVEVAEPVAAAPAVPVESEVPPESESDSGDPEPDSPPAGPNLPAPMVYRPLPKRPVKEKKDAGEAESYFEA